MKAIFYMKIEIEGKIVVARTIFAERGCEAELRNVNSFTRCKTLELNCTPRKARESRKF